MEGGDHALLHPRTYVIFGVSFCLAATRNASGARGKRRRRGKEGEAGRRPHGQTEKRNCYTTVTVCPYVLCIPSAARYSKVDSFEKPARLRYGHFQFLRVYYVTAFHSRVRIHCSKGNQCRLGKVVSGIFRKRAKFFRSLKLVKLWD